MMNMNIIPSPQYVSAVPKKTGGKLSESIKKIYITETLKSEVREALKFLPEVIYTSLEDADLMITTERQTAEKFYTPDYSWFEHKNAAEQGYMIKGFPDGRILIHAENRIGILYAVSTFIQIPAVEPCFEIRDYPDFRYRGNKWLLWAETEIWSYDFGDGLEAYKKRIVRKLDLCLQYKINMVLLDALGFDSERFPGYAALMKSLCKEARKRGVYLISCGYTMGYGIIGHVFGELYGKVHKNLTNYPDGDVYACMGNDSFDSNTMAAREFGTCISNEALMDEKLAEIRKYITDTQIGALYMHNIDSSLIRENVWLSRCDTCRAKWPNDDLFAEDGMAGAFAYFFDRLNGGLKGIQSDDYDSSKDLLLLNVSPGYMEYCIKDDEFYKASRFWYAVQKYTKVKENVIPLFRELFINREDHTERIPELAKNWDTRQDFGIINFSGGDGFYTDKLFFISSVLNYMFKGANMILTCCGNAFQEPLQVFNAEYMWNCENSSFYNLEEKPTEYDSFMKLYFACQRTEFRPQEIYGDGGMLDVICDKLYGKHGLVMSKLFKLCGKNFECPVPFACNKETETDGHDVFLTYRWDNELTEDAIKKLIDSFSEMMKLTLAAEDLLQREKDASEDLILYRRMLTLNKRIVTFWYEYLKLYLETDTSFRNNTETDQTVLNRIDALIHEVNTEWKWHKEQNFETVDLMGGALARREEMLDLLRYNLDLMKKSILTRKRIPDDRRKIAEIKWW